MSNDEITRTLDLLPYGLYVIAAGTENDKATIIANWVTQVSFSPKLLAVALENDSSMKEYFLSRGYFALNILPAGGKEIARSFLRSTTGQQGNVIAGRTFRPATHGSPFLLDALASCECRVVNSFPAGDHMIFIAEVLEAAVNGSGAALTLQETGWHYRGK